MRRHVICLAIGLLLSASLAAAPSATVVQTDAGSVRGVTLGGGAVAFRGIPYAAPPIGALRWRPTQPAQPWKGVRDATLFGPDCPQPVRPGREGTLQSEDCLTLNLVTPDAKASKLPVLVLIHGGAFFVGSGRDLADQDASVILQAGVVLVSPNYRLGRLGFFSHPEWSRRSRERGDDLANYWLMDQIAALQWVRRNIERFGGDPNNVTILGCSAGGSSINALMAAPDARGLFARASARSGGGFFNATRPLDTAEAQGREFAARISASNDAAALDRLLAMDADAILALESGPPNFGAVVDGQLLPEPTSVSFANGRIAHVPYMVGSTSDEASVFGLMGFDRKVLGERFGIDVDGMRRYYGAASAIDDAELLRQVQTDFIFTSASLGMATLASVAGLPAYAYYFDYVRESEAANARGAAHCADMPYSFGMLSEPAPNDLRIAKMMQDYLLAFIRNGDPNAAGQPRWPRFQKQSMAPLVISTVTQAVPGFRAGELEPWYLRWARESGQRFPSLTKP